MSNSPVAAIAARSGNHMAGTITEPDVTDPIAASSAIASFAPLTHPRSSMCGISIAARGVTVARTWGAFRSGTFEPSPVV